MADTANNEVVHIPVPMPDDMNVDTSYDGITIELRYVRAAKLRDAVLAAANGLNAMAEENLSKPEGDSNA